MVSDERELVVELDPLHTLTGHRHDYEIAVFESEAPVRRGHYWRYECSCGELVDADADTAMRHLGEVRGRGVVA